MPVSRKGYFLISFIVLLVFAAAAQLIPIGTGILVFTFAMALLGYEHYLHRNKPLGFYLCWLAAIILGVGVGIYRPSDFNYPLIFSVDRLYEGGLPFSLYVNTAKFFAGYMILCLLDSSVRQSSIYVRSRLYQYLLAFGSGFILLLIAFVSLDLEVHIKALNLICAFALVNLLVTCVTEEAFMRLLLQAQIQVFMTGKTAGKYWQELIPLLIATVIFALTHFTHSGMTMFVFSLAGFIYGVIYSLTKNFWACVAVHFTVNILHFSFLTYPLA